MTSKFAISLYWYAFPHKTAWLWPPIPEGFYFNLRWKLSKNLISILIPKPSMMILEAFRAIPYNDVMTHPFAPCPRYTPSTPVSCYPACLWVRPVIYSFIRPPHTLMEIDKWEPPLLSLFRSSLPHYITFCVCPIPDIIRRPCSWFTCPSVPPLFHSSTSFNSVAHFSTCLIYFFFFCIFFYFYLHYILIIFVSLFIFLFYTL